MSKIDILLATYNGKEYLEEQIESILNQTFEDFKLIISDDNSTDGTKDILKKYEKKDKRIKVYYQKKNLGYNNNFEFLCEKSTSKYIMISDQDDVWLESKIEKMYNIIEEKKYIMLYCDMKIVDSSLNEINKSFHESMKKTVQCRKYHDFELLKIENVISGSSVIFDSEILKKALPFKYNDEVIYDYWLALIASQYGKIYYLEEQLQLYRQHEKNSVGANKQEFLPTFSEYRNRIIDYKYSQYELLYENRKLFIDKDKIDYYFNIIKEIKDSKKRNKFKILKLYNTETITRKISMLLLYNYPKLANLLYNMKYKGVIKK